MFRGEVARACGGLAGGTEAYGDTILFTENEDVLDMVAGFDQTYQVWVIVRLFVVVCVFMEIRVVFLTCPIT